MFSREKGHKKHTGWGGCCRIVCSNFFSYASLMDMHDPISACYNSLVDHLPFTFLEQSSNDWNVHLPWFSNRMFISRNSWVEGPLIKAAMEHHPPIIVPKYISHSTQIECPPVTILQRNVYGTCYSQFECLSSTIL